MHFLSEYTALQLAAVFAGASIIGLAKAGLKGIEMLNVTLMALVFGGKASTGVVLPLLCFADVMAVAYYNRHAQWSHFWKLAPWVVGGILAGVWIGKNIDESAFRRMMAVIILVTVGMMIWMETRREPVAPQRPIFSAGLGLATGFTTMIGNLAGAFSNLYFMAMRMPKNDFIGTAAWLFLCINFFKLPFQAFYWGNINAASLKMDLILAPALILGFVAGLRMVARVQDAAYRKLVLALTLIGATVILI